ncbi:MAG: acetylglutamate kinase, partial [Chloroflexi bacterium]|nr:acetylglutamate kinase [Chloroflexota bacterium]
MNPRQASMFIRSGIAKGGMIPKLEACLKALPRVPLADIIDGRRPGALKRCVLGEAMGTRVQAV